ncbi:hypothetical protein ARMA_2076 [Ardenticatena maritima]|uniref:Uncharacterized protein n=1 Tax=Ardenticatena maritima TaxID=872965 RepID=A0A0M8K7Y3_9CHLR|nr:hypothetical protein ARMA_2076 [Ardenticatena maritima]
MHHKHQYATNHKTGEGETNGTTRCGLGNLETITQQKPAQ